MSRMKECPQVTLLLLMVMVLLLLPVSLAVDKAPKRKRWTPTEFPNPQKDLKACGRPGGIASSICDPERILSTEEQNMVDGLINEIAAGSSPFKKSECGAAGDQGFQVAVAVFHKMSGAKHSDKAVEARDFARALHDRWGVGKAECQNGALLLLAVGDRQVYISTGAGIKAVVSQTQLQAVLDAAKPALKHRRYAEGILSMVQQLGLLMSGQQPEPGGIDSDDGLGIFLFFAGSVAAVMGWAWLSNKKRHKRYKDCADKLAAIKRDQAAIRSLGYACSSCPICLEDFEVPLTAAGAAAAARAAATAGTPAPAPPSQPSASVLDASAASSSLRSAGVTRRAAAASGSAEEEHSDAGEGNPSAPLLGTSSDTGGAGPSRSSSSAVLEAPGSASKDKKGGSSRAAAEQKKAAAGRKPLVLRCGHAFCDPCITKWLETNTTCPICRKDLDANESQPSSSNRDSQGQPRQQQQPDSPQGASCGRAGAAAAGAQMRPEDVLRRQVWLPELGFRLRRLRMMYPDFVTDPMLYTWEEDLAGDRDLDTSVIQTFDPARQQQLEEAGRGGASAFASFGGGNSSGGGGAGASW